MQQNLNSATIALVKFKEAIDKVADNIDQSSNIYGEITNRIKEMSLLKDIEYDRCLYLKQIKNYTGYKITLFADLKNI